ncbi:hypothetical protein FJW01_07675 [Pantoea deleyi]|uniref:Uncharacterized protein n=1 Tax=Pantoea deleyi TaxID=470932 RepID=A0A506QAK6_9GAMM|nr:hypothetical protein FJW01_07675 [Pantoea deleyi]
MPQPGRNGELRRTAAGFFHAYGSRIATIVLWITLCVKIISGFFSGKRTILHQIKNINFSSLFNFRDPIAIFNSAIPCVDIKFMPWRWTKSSRAFRARKKTPAALALNRSVKPVTSGLRGI